MVILHKSIRNIVFTPTTPEADIVVARPRKYQVIQDYPTWMKTYWEIEVPAEIADEAVEEWIEENLALTGTITGTETGDHVEPLDGTTEIKPII